MTAPSITWTPCLAVGKPANPCGLCSRDDIDTDAVVYVAMKETRKPLCQSCVESYGPAGEALWMLADALDRVDSAICWAPESHRPGLVEVLSPVLSKLAEMRRPPQLTRCKGCGGTDYRLEDDGEFGEVWICINPDCTRN